MPITLDGTLGVGTPGITLAGSAITASANQLNNASEDMNAENRIINGNFRVWQRAASSTAYGYVAADRWSNVIIGGTVTQSLQTFPMGDTLGVNSPIYFLRQNVTGQTLAGHVAVTSQHIESIRSYAGQTITVMGWARRFSGTGNMAIELEQTFGTGGSPSATISGISPTTITLGATWAPFAAVMTVPSIAGKTIGTNGNDTLLLNFWTSAGSDWNFRNNSLGIQTIAVDLWGIHIRVGAWTAADVPLYRERDAGTELALCQRYYCLSLFTVRFNATIGGQIEESPIYWPVTMRGTPATTLAAGAVNAVATVQSPNLIGARAELVSSAAGDARHINATVTADAEL